MLASTLRCCISMLFAICASALAFEANARALPTGGSFAIQEAYLKASNTDASDEFGSAVAVSVDTVVVGAARESSGATGVNGSEGGNEASHSGAAYVYVRAGASWSQQAYLKASNTGADDAFGYSVALSGDTLAIGAPYESSGSSGVGGNQLDDGASEAGAVYVFVRSGTGWSQQAYLKASNPGGGSPGDRFGTSVALSGDTLVVGAAFEDSSATGVNGNQASNGAAFAGAAYVFTRSGTAWSQQAYLKASNTDAFDQFGHTVAVAGDTVVVGAPHEASASTGVDGDGSDDSAADSGAAYVFVRSGTSWSQQAYLKASNTDAYDYFGVSVAIDADTVLVGAYRESSRSAGVNGPQSDNSRSQSGAAYAFVRAGSTWSQEAYLKASNTSTTDRFGRSVSVSGDRAVVSARGEASSATGLNGDQSLNDALWSGGGYVYTRSGTNWMQQMFLKASNAEANDVFGAAAAVAGELVVVGAPGEESSSSGVDSVQSDNGAFGAGAAYVFAMPDTGVAFCFGDGSSTVACPCANASAPGSEEGCANSTGTGGLLTATGFPSVVADSVTLWVHQLPPNDFGVFVQNVAVVVPAPFYDGLLCLPLDGHLQRHYGPPDVNPTYVHLQGVGKNEQALTTGDYLGDTRVGATVYYQFWHRDTGGPCGTGASFTNGQAVAWGI